MQAKLLLAFVKNVLRFILFCWTLLAAAGVAFAVGEYQTARDNKTKVWNWTPKSGETVSWSGDRDGEGYGSGFGDLTLYDGSGKVAGVYYGNMSHGRFEGPVNLHNASRTLHAYFAAGDRVSGWSRGRAPSNMPVPQEAQKRRAEAEKQDAEEEKLAAQKQGVPEATPIIKKAKPVTQTIAKTETSPRSSSEGTGRGPDTYHKESTEKPATVAEEKKDALEMPTPPTLHDTAKAELSAPSSRATSFAEPTAFPASTPEQQITESTPLPTTQPSEPENRPTPATNLPDVASHEPATTENSVGAPPVLHEQPPSAASVAPSQAERQELELAQSPSPPAQTTENALPSANETPADVSVNALTGPPSSLRPGGNDEPAEKSEPSAMPKHEGPLTEAEVISLVEREARTHGAPIDKYEAPKVDHSAVKGKWTLFYARKADVGPELAPGFTATVDDKTQQVQVQIHK